jgi:hypothetical protein
VGAGFGSNGGPVVGVWITDDGGGAGGGGSGSKGVTVGG